MSKDIGYENVRELTKVRLESVPVKAHKAVVSNDKGSDPYIEALTQEISNCSSHQTDVWFSKKQQSKRLKKLMEELLQVYSDKMAELEVAKAKISFLKQELEHEKNHTAEEIESKQTLTQVYEDKIQKWNNTLRYYRNYLSIALKRERERHETMLQTLHDLENLEWGQSKDAIIDRLRFFLNV